MSKLLLVIIGFVTIQVSAQHIRPLKEVAGKLEEDEIRLIAERLFQERQYYASLEYYKRLDGNAGLEKADEYTVAKLHYLLKDYSEALSVYEKLATGNHDPTISYDLGRIYITQRRYKEAESSFQSVLASRASSDLKNKARERLQNLSGSRKIITNKPDERITIIRNNGDLNLQSGKYGYDGEEYFDAEREVRTRKKFDINSDLTVELDSILVQRIYKINSGRAAELNVKVKSNNTSLSGAVTGFVKNEALFTLHNPLDGAEGYEIYSSVRNGSDWSEPRQLTARINASSYSTKDPAVARTTGGDMFLFFSSNRPGGFGGYDIWMSQYVQGEFKKPVNLGIGINTSEDEITPFFDVSTGYLFFSSNGHAGIGEMDVFLTRVNWGQGTGKTFNIGEPLNTPFDDFNFSLDPQGKNGLVTSNRYTNCCDRLVRFTLSTPFSYSELPPTLVDVTTFDQFDSELTVLRQSFNYEELAYNEASTEFILKEDADIEGSLANANIPLANRRILLVDKMGEVVSSTISDDAGKFSFKLLPAGGQYRFVLNEPNPTLTIDIKLLNKKGKVFGRLNNTEKPGLFDFKLLEDYSLGVWTLDVEDATISGQLLGTSIGGEKVLLVDYKGGIVAAARTDNKGRFSFKKLPSGEKYSFVLQAQDAPMNVNVDVKDRLGNVIEKFSSTTSKQLFKYRELDEYATGTWTINTTDASISGSLVVGRLALGNKKVLLVDADGKVIGASLTDKTGKFTFRELPPGKRYSFVIEESETAFNIDVALLDENGNIVTRFSSNNRQEIFKYRSLEDYELGVYTLNEEGASFKGTLSADDKGLGEHMVVLLDEAGNMLEGVFTNSLGEFAFSDLTKGQRYAFAVALDNRSQRIQISIVDRQGSIVETLDNQSRSEIFRYRDLAEHLSIYYALNSTVCGQFEITEPGVHQVVLVDEGGQEIACVEANAYGYFQMDAVPFSSAHRFILDGCDTEAIVKIEVVDAMGANTFLIRNDKHFSYFRYEDFNSYQYIPMIARRNILLNQGHRSNTVCEMRVNLTNFKYLRS